jgi:hypothetical protein
VRGCEAALRSDTAHNPCRTRQAEQLKVNFGKARFTLFLFARRTFHLFRALRRDNDLSGTHKAITPFSRMKLIDLIPEIIRAE